MIATKKEIIEAVANLKVLELAELIKEMEEHFGVVAAMQVAAPGGGEQAAAAEEKTEFSLVLEEAGSNKIAIIKAVREMLPQLGLAEAKAMVDAGAGKVLKEGLSKQDAQDFLKKITDAGGKASVK